MQTEGKEERQIKETYIHSLFNMWDHFKIIYMEKNVL